MRAVTFHAAGRVRLSLRKCLSMDAAIEIYLLIFMTAPAADCLKALGMREVLDSSVGMAVDALEILMDGFREYLHVHEEEDLLPCTLSRQLRIGMTRQACFIVLRLEEQKAAEEENRSYENPCFHLFTQSCNCTVRARRKQHPRSLKMMR